MCGEAGIGPVLQGRRVEPREVTKVAQVCPCLASDQFFKVPSENHPVCAYACVCLCEYKRGLYLARDDAFNLEPHSSAPCSESWRKLTLATREGVRLQAPT